MVFQAISKGREKDYPFVTINGAWGWATLNSCRMAVPSQCATHARSLGHPIVRSPVVMS